MIHSFLGWAPRRIVADLTCPNSTLIDTDMKYTVSGCLLSCDADCGQEVCRTRGALNRNLAQTRLSNDASDINRLQSDDLHLCRSPQLSADQLWSPHLLTR